MLLATFTVVNTDDDGPGSLRRALLDAAQSVSDDLVAFDIPGDGVHAIRPASPLPPVSFGTTIDGYTQPGSRPNTASVGSDAAIRVELAGPNAGLEFAGDLIRGLAIHGDPDAQIALRGERSRVEGNLLGLDAAGRPGGGAGHGILVDGSGSNSIGGAAPEARNVISGNGGAGIVLIARVDVFTSPISGATFETTRGGFNRVRGNLIGTDPSGRAPLGNGGAGIALRSFGDEIGGDEAGAGNVISGNGGHGIAGAIDLRTETLNLTGRPLRIFGNLIGTDANGAEAVGNAGSGIAVTPGNFQVMIGGADPGLGNVVSGNAGDGVVVNSGSVAILGNRIGTDRSGDRPLGNGRSGVALTDTLAAVGGAEPGAGNRIAFNALDGVVRTRAGSVLSDAIFDNGGPAIAGAAGPATVTIVAVRETAEGTVVEGTIAATPTTTVTIQLFAAGSADSGGRTPLDTFDLPSVGEMPFSHLLATPPPPGQPFVAATATAESSPMGPRATSGFSRGVRAAPPAVLRLSRLGVLARPTRLLIAFDAPIDPITADDPANYRLDDLGRDRLPGTADDRPVAINSASYDPASLTVTLSPSHRLPLRRAFRLTVLGTPPGGLTGAGGTPIDGDGDGLPGGDFLAVFGPEILSLPRRG